jgi:hypothetical protein
MRRHGAQWPVPPHAAAARGLEVSLGGIFQNGLLDRQIGHDALEPLVLPLQFLQPTGLIALEPP